jgi:hypothetical protein
MPRPSFVLLGLVSLGCAALASGCSAAASSPAAQLSDAANDLNSAARFGRTDLALEQTTPEFRDTFLLTRQAWGGEIRIVDMNVTSIQLGEDDSADVLVSVAWTRMSESTLKTTVVSQSWQNARKGGWQLSRERRVDGDPGLFGEPRPLPRAAAPRRDVHYPSKSLGSVE